MSRRGRLVACAAAALLLAGCKGLGLNPFPEPGEMPEEDSPYELGLDPFPEPMHPGGSSDTGLDPFPAPMNPGGSSLIGLDPFPSDMPPALRVEKRIPAFARGTGEGFLGLHPFPTPMNPGGSSSLGLDPFPRTKGEPTLAPAGPRKRSSHLDSPTGEYPVVPAFDPGAVPLRRERREKPAPAPKR